MTTTITWADGSGNWNTATDWNPQTVPNSGTVDAVLGTLTGSPPYVVTLDTAITVDSISIDTSQPTLDVEDAGNTVTILGSLANGGIAVGGGTLLVDVSDGGGTNLDIGGLLGNAGTAVIGATGNTTRSTLTAAAIVNSGPMSLIGDSVTTTGNLGNSSTLQIDASGTGGSDVAVGGTLSNTATMTVGNGTQTAATMLTAAALANSGRMSLSGGGANMDVLSVGAGGIINSGTTTGVGDNSATLTIVGVTLSTTGNFTNDGTVKFDASGTGGDTMTIGGTLNNSGGSFPQFFVGDASITQGVTVTAEALSQTGFLAALYIAGAASVQATVDITTPAPTVWTGAALLSGDALLEFAGGSIQTIADGAVVRLTGADALVADAGSTTGNSALSGVSYVAGALEIGRGNTVAINGNLTVNGGTVFDAVEVDGYATGAGGSKLTIAGTLDIGDAEVAVGGGELSTPSLLTAQALTITSNFGQVDVNGNQAGGVQGTLDITNQAAPATWVGEAIIGGDALLEFDGGQIATIGGGTSGMIELYGSGARIADFGTTGYSSALANLTVVGSRLEVEAGASLSNAAGVNLTSNELIGVDDETTTRNFQFYARGGSTLGIGGTLTNNGRLDFGNSFDRFATTVTAQGFVNNGRLFMGSTAGVDFTVNSAAPTTYIGYAAFAYKALLDFTGGGEIETIGTSGHLELGAQGLIASGTATTTDSALVDLTENDGTLHLGTGAALTTNAGVNLTNTGSLVVAGDLSIGGTLVNSSQVSISGIVTAAGLANTGTGGISLSDMAINGAATNAGNILIETIGTATINGALTNTGMVSVAASFSPADFKVTGAVSGNGGTFEIAGATSVVEFGSTVGNGQTIEFVPNAAIGGALVLDDPVDFAGTIAGMAVGTADHIDLTDVPKSDITAAQLDTNTDLLSVTTTNVGTLDFRLSGTYAAGTQVSLSADGSGTDVGLVPCFCRGTRITTAAGEVAVEDLIIGDAVRTLSGALRPIKWIGRRSYDGRFVARKRHVLPILVKAGALADGTPRRDLWLSPHHALYLDGVLVPAECLINGVSVLQYDFAQLIDYFHIELDSHDVLLAEGAPAESFVDCDSRGMFQNAHEFARIYPGEAPPRWAFCAPRLEAGPALATIQRRIDRRAGLEWGPLDGWLDAVEGGVVRGWARDPLAPGRRIGLVVTIDGKVAAEGVAADYRADLVAAGHGDGRHGFRIRLPQALDCAARREVRVRRQGDGAELRGSPMVVGSAAERAA